MATYVTNQELKDAIGELKVLLEQSAADRAQLNARMGAMEARNTVIAAQMAKIDRAIHVQLVISDWWERRKVRLRLSAVAGVLALLWGKEVATALAHVVLRWMGWM